MNQKLKKAVAIIGLIFMGLFLASMVIFFVNSQLFDGMLWLVALLCFGIAVVMFCVIYFTRGFPAQQAKRDELKKLEEAYYKKLAKTKDETQSETSDAQNSEETVQNVATDD